MKGLKEMRKEKKLTIRALAKILGVTQQTIYNYERGARFPSKAMLVKIANYFGCTIDSVM